MQNQYYEQNPPMGQPMMQQQGYPPMGQPMMQQQGYPPMGQPIYPPSYPPQQGYQQPYYGQGQYPPAPPPPQPSENMPQVIVYQQKQSEKGNSSNLPYSADGVPYSARVYCSNCRKGIQTLIQEEAGTGTWTCCVIWCLLAAPFCFIPFCISTCKDKIHICPHCQTQVGVFEYKVC